MCGLSGFVAKKTDYTEGVRQVRQMNARISHRGPDDSGVWGDEAAGVFLGHQRLSIVDLSNAGHQPMHSACGRFAIIFNGEIYNHAELRKQLSPRTWVGHSDTETLLACFEQWGVVSAIEKCIGMFAIALWDKTTHVLTLIRDRMGEKPIYYGWQQGVFLFGSELKALRANKAFVGEINRDAIAMQLRHCYVPTPYTIYRDIFKLPAGTYIQLKVGSGEIPRSEPVAYWSLEQVAQQGQGQLYRGNDETAANELEVLFRQSITSQMLGDVPVGAFLSGGIDSSLVVALMQTSSSSAVNTFSIGFDDASYNEAGFARAVAQHLGTNHHELYVSERNAVDLVPRLPDLYDEPFSDSSQIPTFLVSQLAREHVKVSLSGDGGDELFGGYNRYLLTAAIWRRLAYFPAWFRDAVAVGLTKISAQDWSKLIRAIDFLLPSRLRFSSPGDKVHRFAEIMRSGSPQEIYIKLISHWDNAANTVFGANEPISKLNSSDLWPQQKNFTNQMMLLDGLTYLSDDILVKLDRATMGVGLEGRAPFLDHRLVNFAWSLPLDMKIRGGQTKWLLRQVLYRYVPKHLIERPKMGFGVPLGDWLRGSLRDWAESLLNPARLKGEGFLNTDHITSMWDEHIKNKKNWQYQLWNVLMFQAWLNRADK
jgi:asparagine synthase (glutamine-hydrolysing)